MSAEGGGNKVRRIAILVTSLDASAGRQLLMAMPTELARQVRRAMAQLGHVEPEEQRQILAEFRMQAMLASDGIGESVDQRLKPDDQPAAQPDSPANFKAQLGVVGQSYATATETNPYAEQGSPKFQPTTTGDGFGARSGSAPTGLDGVNFSALGELLRAERATVVAVVINQLDPLHAAELLGKLPKPLQREVIVSLPRLGQIDPDAMAAIHEHLASRIADYHHRQAGESESTSRMHELLAAAAPDLRSDWQSTLLQAEPLLAARMGFAPPVAARSTVAETTKPIQPKNGQVAGTAASFSPRRDNAAAAQSLVPAYGDAGAAQSLVPAYDAFEMLANNVVTTADLRVARNLASSPTAKTIDQSVAQLSVQADDSGDDRARILPFPSQATAPGREPSLRFEQLLDLPAEEIGQILAAAETDVILYALAGASPLFMKRFMSMLDRADGRALQLRLKQLRAINLKDVDAAQRRLCELADGRQSSKVAA